MNKPNIIEVIGQRVELRSAGRQWRALCPFHSEKTPSFYVSDDRGFHCFGCGAKGGDAIDFIQMIDGVGFHEACARLGIDGNEHKPKPVDSRKRHAAATLARWMNEHHQKIGAILRQLSREIAIAEEAGATTLVERFEREFSILETLFDDLQRPQYALELWAARDSVETITARSPVEPLPAFPPWTAEYADYLAAHLPALEAVS